MAINFDKIPSPCFVVEESKLRGNLDILREIQQKSGAEIILALKGFAMFSVFNIIREYLPGCTASSLNEARLAFEEFGGEVHAYAPAYTDEEFGDLMRYCEHISFNSLSQFERHKPKILVSDKKISCGLRINPEYSEVTTALYNPCLPGTRFGITADKIGAHLPEGIEGLHFHTLCQNDSDVLERTFEAVEAKFGHLLHEAKWLNMGGGHHITKPTYDRERLIKLIRRIREKYRIKVILEPGEAIAIHTGYLVSRVLDILDSGGINVAVLDVSFTAHMPDCLEMPYKPDILGATDPVLGKPTYRMGGTTCLSGDFMGDYSFDKPLQIGDKIILDDMSHYTMVKTSNFNGVEHPSIGIWQANDTFKLVKKFAYEMYKDRLS